MTKTSWLKTSAVIRDFNGCIQTAFVGAYEVGVFKELHGRPWSVRTRLRSGVASWGRADPFDTKRECIAYADSLLGVYP